MGEKGETPPPTPKILARTHPALIPASKSPRKKCQWCDCSRDLSQYASNPRARNGVDGVCIPCRENLKKMCTGKTGRYVTESTAIAAAIRVSASTGKPWRHYRCTRCKNFHLTTKVSVARPPDEDTG